MTTYTLDLEPRNKVKRFHFELITWFDTDDQWRCSELYLVNNLSTTKSEGPTKLLWDERNELGTEQEALEEALQSVSRVMDWKQAILGESIFTLFRSIQ